MKFLIFFPFKSLEFYFGIKTWLFISYTVSKIFIMGMHYI